MKPDPRLEIKAEILISRLLRTGVAVSAVLVVAGMVIVFQHHPLYRTSHDDLASLTSASGEYPHQVRDVLHSVRNGRGQGVAMLGLLLLIATPVLRVAVSIAIFALERDWLFTMITTLVLGLLLLSFALGAA